MFLPGECAPERWVWDRMGAHPDDFAAGLGLDRDDLAQQIKRKDAHYASAASSPDKVAKDKAAKDKAAKDKAAKDKAAKDKLHDLSEVVKRSVPEICRIVSRRETEREESDIQPLVKGLVDAFQTWRGEA